MNIYAKNGIKINFWDAVSKISVAVNENVNFKTLFIWDLTLTIMCFILMLLLFVVIESKLKYNAEISKLHNYKLSVDEIEELNTNLKSGVNIKSEPNKYEKLKFMLENKNKTAKNKNKKINLINLD